MMRIIKMNSKLIPNKAKVVALSLLIACSGLGGTAFAASSAPRIGIQGTDAAAATQTQSTSTGFQLRYFHAEGVSKTYALTLRNGLSASFDFETNTVTLIDVAGRQKTFPLDQALLQAANGNSQAAAEMYDQLYQSIVAAKSDAIMVYAGQAGISANARQSTAGPRLSPNFFFPPPRDTGGFGDDDGSLWATPTGGNCFPIPGSCDQWEGGLTYFGPGSLPGGDAYNQWWGSAFGDPPPTTQPPRPDGCAPNDIDCILHEHDRQVACDDNLMDNVAMAGSTLLTAGACYAAVQTAGLATAACAGSIAGTVVSVHNLEKHSRQCHTPYPGH